MRTAAVCASAVLLVACAGGPDRADEITRAATEGDASVDDLYVVDCLLPGQVRRVGGMTYLTPRRPTRTTVQDCRIRGGEYVAYDRADYRTALNVWLEEAEQGDAKAQNYVGEIFEKGLGTDPDYVTAATWYRRAADQGYSRAMINLGFLYEQGLGVEKDSATALNLYRRASGVEDDELLYRSEMDEELAALREELHARLSTAVEQQQALERQLERMRSEREELERELEEARQAQEEAEASPEGEVEIGQIELDDDPPEDPRTAELAAHLASAQDQITTMESLFEQLSRERDQLEEELAELPDPAEEADEETGRIALEERGASVVDGIDFGRYYALIIGNQEYEHMDDLESPITDAGRIQQILEDKYGFSVTFLPNANQVQILRALNDLYEQITPEDNLLVYYAGYGNRSEGRRQRGYWLPVDAHAERSVRWINHAVISDHLDRIEARSILVLADSLFAASLTSDSSALLLGSQAQLTSDAIRSGLNRRSRLVISSGSERPITDTIDPQHSRFARSLIEVLEDNDEVIRDNMLYARVAVNTRTRSRDDADGATSPEIRPIRDAGHEGGDFFLVPRSVQQLSRQFGLEAADLIAGDPVAPRAFQPPWSQSH